MRLIDLLLPWRNRCNITQTVLFMFDETPILPCLVRKWYCHNMT